MLKNKRPILQAENTFGCFFPVQAAGVIALLSLLHRSPISEEGGEPTAPTSHLKLAKVLVHRQPAEPVASTTFQASASYVLSPTAGKKSLVLTEHATPVPHTEDDVVRVQVDVKCGKGRG